MIDFTIRKKYNKNTLKNMWRCFGAAIGCIALILLFYLMDDSQKEHDVKAVAIFLGIFSGISIICGILDIIDIGFGIAATRSFDKYVKKLPIDEQRRIEQESKNVNPSDRIAFLDKELLIMSESLLKICRYKDIAVVEVCGLLFSLYRENEKKAFEFIDIGAFHSPKKTVQILNEKNPKIIFKFVQSKAYYGE